MTVGLVSLAEVKSYMGSVNNPNNDDLLRLLIPTSLVAIGNYCNRNFVSGCQSEWRNGNGSKKITLVKYPVTSVNSLSINGKNIPVSIGGSPGYFFVPNGRVIVLVGCEFTQGERNVVINYEAGYGDDAGLAPWPDDLKLALIMYVVTRYNEKSHLGIGSKALGTETIAFTSGPTGTSGASAGIPSAASNILKNYINFVPESGA